jgi:hypothetical protein
MLLTCWLKKPTWRICEKMFVTHSARGLSGKRKMYLILTRFVDNNEVVNSGY